MLDLVSVSHLMNPHGGRFTPASPQITGWDVRSQAGVRITAPRGHDAVLGACREGVPDRTGGSASGSWAFGQMVNRCAKAPNVPSRGRCGRTLDAGQGVQPQGGRSNQSLRCALRKFAG